MEPKLPTPNRGPEHLPSSSPNFEQRPIVSSPETPSTTPERFREHVEQRGESSPREVNATILPPPITLPQPAPPVDTPAKPVPTDDNPLVADDNDLIEKEWVDKAKKIIVETKDDPYKREQEVGRLQADYLRKRYGKELGVSN